ncbi:MAG: hypothetical protein ABI728_02205 [Betaproteobacteria bacterium]
MGFFKAPLQTVEAHLSDWLKEIKGPRGISIRTRPVSGHLEDALRSLLPSTLPDIERYLLIPTGGPWTAYLDNLHGGTDPSAVAYLSTRMRCTGVYCVARPAHALVLSLYGPGASPEQGNTLRDIRLFRDVDGWVFRQSGQPLAFENTDAYRADSVEARFTVEMLERYLRELGIRAFEEGFYLPCAASEARLIELVRP